MLTVETPSNVEGSDSDGISGREEGIAAGIQQHEGEDPVQHVDEVLSMLLVLFVVEPVRAEKLEGRREEAGEGRRTRWAMTSQSLPVLKV